MGVDSEVHCCLKCSSLGEDCGAVHYDGDRKTCTMAKVYKSYSSLSVSLASPGLLYKKGILDES